MFDHHKELCPECNIGFLIKESKKKNYYIKNYGKN